MQADHQQDAPNRFIAHQGGMQESRSPDDVTRFGPASPNLTFGYILTSIDVQHAYNRAAVPRIKFVRRHCIGVCWVAMYCYWARSVSHFVVYIGSAPILDHSILLQDIVWCAPQK